MVQLPRETPREEIPRVGQHQLTKFAAMQRLSQAWCAVRSPRLEATEGRVRDTVRVNGESNYDGAHEPLRSSSGMPPVTIRRGKNQITQNSPVLPPTAAPLALASPPPPLPC